MSSSGNGSHAFLSVIPCGSSPESWPIEVGWGFAAGEIRTMRLAPAAGWSLAAWDKSAEACHRLGLEALLREGKEPLDACLILNAALGQSRVYAPQPERDSLFLYKLYRAAGVDPNYRLHATGCDRMPAFKRAEAGVMALRQTIGTMQSG